MDTILEMNINRLTQIDLASFALTVQKAVNSTSALRKEAPVQVTNFNNSADLLNDRVRISRKKTLTQAFLAADKKRDRGFRGYRKGLSFFRDATGAELEAYEKLKDHLNLYSFTPSMARIKQTAVMLQFLPDLLDAKKLAGEVALLNLTPFVQLMEEGNNEVVKLEEEANKEASQVIVGETAMAVKAFIAAYHELIKIVNALITLEGESKFADFRDYLNAVIVEYKRKMLKQKASLTGGGDSGNHAGDGGNSGDGEEEPPQG
jgi:hypothetical protein